MSRSPFYLHIFLPHGIVWECGDGRIRTRWTKTGKIIMRSKRVPGDAPSFLSPARSLTRSGLVKSSV